MNTIKIVTDSSSDLTALADVPFASAPLKIITADKEYVDDERLDVGEMVNDLSVYKGRSSSSCPSPDDWLNAFGDAEQIICITITGALSGSCNSARVAKDIYEEQYPSRRVCVIDSRSTGPEIVLVVEKIREMILEGKSFDEIIRDIVSYRTGLLFMLESIKNLANNGRVNQIVAKLVGLLGIRIVGRASDEGTLEMLHKCSGEYSAVKMLVRCLKEFGYRGGCMKIAHCLNEVAASKLKDLVLQAFSNARVEIYKCRGLCSFYAEKGGLLVGFEV